MNAPSCSSARSCTEALNAPCRKSNLRFVPGLSAFGGTALRDKKTVRERNLKTRCFQFDAYRREILVTSSDAIGRTKRRFMAMYFPVIFFAAIALPARVNVWLSTKCAAEVKISPSALLYSSAEMYWRRRIPTIWSRRAPVTLQSVPGISAWRLIDRASRAARRGGNSIPRLIPIVQACSMLAMAIRSTGSLPEIRREKPVVFLHGGPWRRLLGQTSPPVRSAIVEHSALRSTGLWAFQAARQP